MDIKNLFTEEVTVKGNLIYLQSESSFENQQQTNDVFSEKWKKVDEKDSLDKLYEFQYDWYFKLYGFEGKEGLREFLTNKKVIFDAGCGLGYKAALFAELAPSSTVIGMDFSDSAIIAAEKYAHLPNLYFIQGDIAASKLKSGSIDYVSCDQVIMHTENPEKTFQHLSSLLKRDGEFACYVYSKKALPRELVDDYFRKAAGNFSHKELWEFSQQLTTLGKNLSELNVQFTSPDIPLLGIKGGEYDIQRFIYWNFLKCFWKEDWGMELCNSTNFDWYAPSNAKRYSEEEYKNMIIANNLEIIYFHKEEACYSGRFKK